MSIINHGYQPANTAPPGAHCRGNNNTKPGSMMLVLPLSSPTARLPDSMCRFLLIYPTFLPLLLCSLLGSEVLYMYLLSAQQYCYTTPIVLLYSFWFLSPLYLRENTNAINYWYIGDEHTYNNTIERERETGRKERQSTYPLDWVDNGWTEGNLTWPLDASPEFRAAEP